MTNRMARLPRLFTLLAIALAACGVEITRDDGSELGRGSGSGSGSDNECVVDADCGPGLECEVEEEHGGDDEER